MERSGGAYVITAEALNEEKIVVSITVINGRRQQGAPTVFNLNIRATDILCDISKTNTKLRPRGVLFDHASSDVPPNKITSAAASIMRDSQHSVTGLQVGDSSDTQVSSDARDYFLFVQQFNDLVAASLGVGTEVHGVTFPSASLAAEAANNDPDCLNDIKVTGSLAIGKGDERNLDEYQLEHAGRSTLLLQELW